MSDGEHLPLEPYFSGGYAHLEPHRNRLDSFVVSQPAELIAACQQKLLARETDLDKIIDKLCIMLPDGRTRSALVRGFTAGLVLNALVSDTSKIDANQQAKPMLNWINRLAHATTPQANQLVLDAVSRTAAAGFNTIFSHEDDRLQILEGWAGNDTTQRSYFEVGIGLVCAMIHEQIVTTSAEERRKAFAKDLAAKSIELSTDAHHRYNLVTNMPELLEKFNNYFRLNKAGKYYILTDGITDDHQAKIMAINNALMGTVSDEQTASLVEIGYSVGYLLDALLHPGQRLMGVGAGLFYAEMEQSSFSNSDPSAFLALMMPAFAAIARISFPDTEQIFSHFVAQYAPNQTAQELEALGHGFYLSLRLIALGKSVTGNEGYLDIKGSADWLLEKDVITLADLFPDEAAPE